MGIGSAASKATHSGGEGPLVIKWQGTWPAVLPVLWEAGRAHDQVI